MAALYADEDFSHLVVEELRRLGHDVLTAQEAGQGNRSTPDDTILASATSLGRSVLTHNRRHFVRLHLEGRAHAGIVVRTRDTDVTALAGELTRQGERWKPGPVLGECGCRLGESVPDGGEFDPATVMLAVPAAGTPKTVYSSDVSCYNCCKTVVNRF